MPPSPVPPIGSSLVDLAAGLRQLIGMQRDEITKYVAGRDCRTAVRAENAKLK